MSGRTQSPEEYIRKLDLDQHEMDELVDLLQKREEMLRDSYVTQLNHLVAENDRLKTEIKALTGYIQLKDL